MVVPQWKEMAGAGGYRPLTTWPARLYRAKKKGRVGGGAGPTHTPAGNKRLQEGGSMPFSLCPSSHACLSPHATHTLPPTPHSPHDLHSPPRNPPAGPAGNGDGARVQGPLPGGRAAPLQRAGGAHAPHRRAVFGRRIRCAASWLQAVGLNACAAQSCSPLVAMPAAPSAVALTQGRTGLAMCATFLLTLGP